MHACKWDARTSVQHHPDQSNCCVTCLYLVFTRNLFERKPTSFLRGEENSTAEFTTTLVNFYIFHTNHCWIKCLYKREVKIFQLMVPPWHVFEIIHYNKCLRTEWIMNSLLLLNIVWRNFSALCMLPDPWRIKLETPLPLTRFSIWGAGKVMFPTQIVKSVRMK